MYSCEGDTEPGEVYIIMLDNNVDNIYCGWLPICFDEEKMCNPHKIVF